MSTDIQQISETQKKWSDLKVPLLQLTKQLQKVANQLSATITTPSTDPIVIKNKGKFEMFVESILRLGETDFMVERLTAGAEDPPSSSSSPSSSSTSSPRSPRNSSDELTMQSSEQIKKQEDFVYYHLKAIRCVESVLLVVDRKLRKDTTEESTLRREKLKLAVSIKTSLEEEYNRLRGRGGGDLMRLYSDESLIIRSVSCSSFNSDGVCRYLYYKFFVIVTNVCFFFSLEEEHRPLAPALTIQL